MRIEFDLYFKDDADKALEAIQVLRNVLPDFKPEPKGEYVFVQDSITHSIPESASDKPVEITQEDAKAAQATALAEALAAKPTRKPRIKKEDILAKADEQKADVKAASLEDALAANFIEVEPTVEAPVMDVNEVLDTASSDDLADLLGEETAVDPFADVDDAGLRNLIASKTPHPANGRDWLVTLMTNMDGNPTTLKAMTRAQLIAVIQEADTRIASATLT